MQTKLKSREEKRDKEKREEGRRVEGRREEGRREEGRREEGRTEEYRIEQNTCGKSEWQASCGASNKQHYMKRSNRRIISFQTPLISFQNTF